MALEQPVTVPDDHLHGPWCPPAGVVDLKDEPCVVPPDPAPDHLHAVRWVPEHFAAVAVLALDFNIDGYLLAFVDPGGAQPEGDPDTRGPGARHAPRRARAGAAKPTSSARRVTTARARPTRAK